MDCERFFDSLTDDAGSGDSTARNLLHDHLDACPGCRRTHAVLQRGRAVLRSLPPLPAPDNFFERLQQRIDAFEARRRARAGRLRLAARWGSAGAAALAAFLMISVALGSLDELGGLLKGARSGDSATSGDDAATFAGAATPFVSVVRPLAALVGSDGGAFEGLSSEVAGPHPDGWPGLYRLAATQANAGGYSLRPAAGVQPVLYATPSLTFDASPVAFGFVAAHARSSFPARAR
jgi:hypothetical protein